MKKVTSGCNCTCAGHPADLSALAETDRYIIHREFEAKP